MSATPPLPLEFRELDTSEMERLIFGVPARATCVRGLEKYRAACAATLSKEMRLWTTVTETVPKFPGREALALQHHLDAHNASFLSALSVAALLLGSDRDPARDPITVEDVANARLNVAAARDVARNFLAVASAMYPPRPSQRSE